MCGLAVGKVAEGTARLGAEAEKKWKIFKGSALQVWCILTRCVKILCVSLGCDFGTVPLCTGQILFEMQGGREISLLSANPWAQALLVKRRGSLVSPNKWLISSSFLIREVHIYGNDFGRTQMPVFVCEPKAASFNCCSTAAQLVIWFYWVICFEWSMNKNDIYSGNENNK